MYKHLRNKVRKCSLITQVLYKVNEKISLEPPYHFPPLISPSTLHSQSAFAKPVHKNLFVMNYKIVEECVEN